MGKFAQRANHRIANEVSKCKPHLQVQIKVHIHQTSGKKEFKPWRASIKHIIILWEGIVILCNNCIEEQCIMQTEMRFTIAISVWYVTNSYQLLRLLNGN